MASDVGLNGLTWDVSKVLQDLRVGLKTGCWQLAARLAEAGARAGVLNRTARRICIRSRYLIYYLEREGINDTSQTGQSTSFRS